MDGSRFGDVVQEFNPEGLQSQFLQGYDSGQLKGALYQHWAQYVPFVYSALLDADQGREERQARRVLFKPLEVFICGGDPTVVFQQLKNLDSPPQLCGKVFKNGEPTYACRDCGMDPTCVLCIECFQNSAHKTHRYKMNTSGGGGYCDCGDVEAWKTEPFCNVHKKGVETQKKNPVDNLPAALRQRACQLFRVAVEYAADLLTWTECNSLPDGLRGPHTNNVYITMLFNDEVHTYEQVITTLERAVDCTHKEAIDFATTVDREGRSSVKHGSLADCNKAMQVIEKNTSRLGSNPLLVRVMHSSVVGHQQFALKILYWLNDVISQSDGLRQLFCQLSMQAVSPGGLSVVERMMLADTKLWKAARIQSHQLFMAGILKHQECKKQFAVLFSKMYPALMKCFIDDDHDHSVCAVAESVQMFTVPTLARMLVTELNLLQVILDTFLEHCKPKLNTDGRFAFERQERNPAFRRSQYMLYDLKYVLTCRPSPQEWTDALRASFLNGFSSMLKLLKSMQGMDAVTRQTGQHIEFEPEWEGAFNLQLKLADNLAIIQDWCGTDKTVLLDAIAMTLNTLVACRDPSAKMTVCTVGQWKATCIKYDVSTQPVSIHLPVTRLLAGLYPHLNKLGLSFREAHKQQWLIHGQPQQLIADPWLRVSTVDLIEPSLRTQVLISQTQAGMWRRNGYSLLNQIYFYHNVRCCSEMYDKDVTMLQTGAALIDSNEFIIYLLNKFSLLNWAKEDYDMPSKDGSPDDCLRQVIVLAEEFLNLLIIIIGERYECGVGEVDPEDTIKREIIHQLCIHPMAHSELTKSLPENLVHSSAPLEGASAQPYHETGIDHIVQQVAVFKKPVSSTGKGMYELKPECYTEYNPFFYHYTRAEQSKSEEMQRKRKKSLNEDQALPPPLPPPFAAGYIPVTKLLHSDLLLYLLRILLKRTAAKRSRSWSETQFEKVLHLIGLALYEEQRMHNAGQHFGFIEKATTDNSNILEMLQKLNGHPNITHEPQKDLLTWVIQLFTKTRQSVCGTDAVEMLPVVPSVSDEKLEKERKRKAELAAKRRLRIMAQISKMQKEFIRENSELFESTSCELKLAGSDMDISQSVAQFDMFPIAVGSKRSVSSMTSVMLETCILCQEQQEITHNERAMVLASFIHKSTVLSKSRGKVIEDPEQHDPLFTSADLPVGAHTATCGHIMHADCWQRFFDAILAKERRRTLRFRHHVSYDIDKGEFLCPLCETLSNSVLPIIPHLGTLLKNNTEKEVDLSVNDWLDGIQKTVRSSIQEAKDRESQEEAYLFVPCPMSSITKMMAESVAKNFQLLFDYVYDDSSGHFSDSISEMLRKFSTDAYAIGLGVQADDDNIRVPILAWATCAYTITATEQCLRDEGKPLFGSLPSRQGDCLSSLVKFAAVCSQVIQPDVVKKHCITLLSALVCESADHRLQQTPSVLTMDMFDCLVKLCLSLPTLYAEDVSSNKLSRIPTGGLNDLHCLHMALTAHLVQIMLLASFSEEQESMDTESEAGDCDEEEALLKTYLHLRHKAKLPCEHIPSAWQLWTYVREASLPFLRCAALFFHYLTGVAAPELLLEAGRDEFPLLCQYLALPASLAILFEQGTIIKRLVDSWCEDDSVQRQLLTTGGSGAVATIKYPMRVNHLIDLPHDYIELINKVSTFTCPSSDGDDSRAPALCLVCGKMLCSQSYCCQRDLDNMTVGAATAHAETCGAGIGIFLRVRECHVLLLFNRTKGCFVPAPYLDDYGETDQGLRRGNPLHLCMERYRKLQKLWLTHSIPEEIVHLLEANSNLMAIEWQHL